MTKNVSAEVLILGAGAAGLAAAQVLLSKGIKLIVLEARDRVGGRVFTQHDPASEVPIELGAEFVHGKAPETLAIVNSAGLKVQEVEGDRWCSRKGELDICQSLYDQFERVFKKMKADGRDRSFLEVLNEAAADVPEDIRRLTLEYIEGFEAAKPDRISEHALVREQKAAEEIEGDRAFRVTSGYDSVLKAMMEEFKSGGCELHLNTVVKAVRWGSSDVEVEADCGMFRAQRVLITLPLAVLESGAVRFEPELTAKKTAMAKLETGPVVRVTLRFRERFWEKIEVKGRSMGKMSFLHSDNPYFPTWWTTMPRVSTLLTGWSAGPHGLALSGKSDEEVVDCAVQSLADLLHYEMGRLRDRVEASYFHNWQKDEFSRGAYSYACVGGIDAAFELAKPLEGRLFFAGEATEFNGHQGTVEGAIATGQRAAREVLEGMAGQS